MRLKQSTVPEKPNIKTKPVIKKSEVSKKIMMLGAGKSYGKATLPDTLSTPATKIEDITIAIYGEKKIGKTSLCKRFNESFFLFFEPGGKGFASCSNMMLEWDEFLDYLTLLERNRGYAKTLIIDTIDKCYEMCFKFTCDRENMKHPSDLGYGKGWDAIKQEFYGAMDRVMKLDRGIIFLSHATSQEFLRRSGGTSHKLVSTMSKSAREYITGIADVIAYYGYYGEDRFLTVEGNDFIDAGHRLEENFLTSSGERIHSIPMGGSADEAYQNFVAAFNNQQKERCEPEDATGLSMTRAPMKGKR